MSSQGNLISFMWTTLISSHLQLLAETPFNNDFWTSAIELQWVNQVSRRSLISKGIRCLEDCSDFIKNYQTNPKDYSSYILMFVLQKKLPL